MESWCAKVGFLVIWLAVRLRSGPIDFAKSVGVNLKTNQSEIFLPKGYPDSVSSDYAIYQFWDSWESVFAGKSVTVDFKWLIVTQTELSHPKPVLWLDDYERKSFRQNFIIQTIELIWKIWEKPIRPIRYQSTIVPPTTV